MLLKGQGIIIERPPRALGTAVAVGPAVLAALLGLTLIAKATTWPISFTQFGAISGAIVLFLLALVFAFWAFSCHSLHYIVDRNGLVVAWGTMRHIVPLDRIRQMSVGRGEDRPEVRGLSWPGLHVGRGQARGRETLFYSTHRSPEDLVFVTTDSVTYALSPQDPPRFLAEVERFKQAAQPQGSEIVERDIVGSHPVWADRVAQWLALSAIAVNVALWGYVFAIFPDLSPTITIEFPPLGEITDIHSRNELLKIPAAALAVLATNLALGFLLQRQERAATYLLLSGTVFMQLLFWVSAGIAVANA